jgi:hypothetical protein
LTVIVPDVPLAIPAVTVLAVIVYEPVDVTVVAITG